MLAHQYTMASHLVGGEMNYTSLGNNKYEVKLTIYRDCYYGLAPFDSYARIGVYDDHGNLVFGDSIAIHDTSYVPNAINSPCLPPPSDICYEVAHYYKILTLPPLHGGYTITYQRCCRNNSILNVANPGTSGATYTATIPDQYTYKVNSNPFFTKLPPTFICVNAPFTFNHSAIDVDGDSLVYELSEPLDGAYPGNPAPVPDPPPYQPLIFLTPYSLSNVMGGTPLRIDSRTGLLQATPSAIGQYAYGVSVKEYRNGIFIGETRRDFQVNVINCPDYTVASMISPINACGNLNVQFTNRSFGGYAYTWDFGDPTAINDTSNLANPTYTYPDTGTYYVKLIAYSQSVSNCNDTTYGVVYVYPPYNAHFGILNAKCSAKFDFVDSSFGNTSGNWNFRLWNFGDGSYSTGSNPSHYYPNSGNYTITLIASADSGCADTISKAITVQTFPISAFSASMDSCSHTVDFINSSANASSYYWNFGDGTSDNSANPSHVYLTDGKFTVELIAKSSNGCADTLRKDVTIASVPIANFNFNVNACGYLVNFTNLSLNASNVQWDFGDQSYTYNNDPLHFYKDAGTYTVNLKVFSANAVCFDSITKQVVVGKPTAAFKTAVDTCSLKLSTTNKSLNAVQYQWQFSDGTSGVTSVDAVHTFSTGGSYVVQLVAIDAKACTDTATVAINLPNKPKANFSSQHIDCDSVVNFTQQSVNAVKQYWQFGDNETSDVANPAHTYHITGDISVSLVVTSLCGCTDSMQKTMPLLIRTPAAFNYVIDSCKGEVYFENNSPLALSYYWNFGDSTSSILQKTFHTYPVNKNYVVNYTINKGTACEEQIQEEIKYEVNTGEYVYIPSSFTPNDDGKNEVFEIKSWMPCDTYSILIVNRWGQTVFETDDAVKHPWNGSCKGNPVAEGVYAYLLKGHKLEKVGYVFVMRSKP